MINSIIKFLFKGYDNTLAAMVTRIIAVVDSVLTGQTAITPVLEKVKTLTAVLNDALRRNRKGAYTDALVIDDTDRDDLYLAWVLRLESDMHCTYNQQIVSNAKKLYSELVENGRVLKKGYLDESNQLENLFRRYDNYASLISENSIQELYDHLVAAQKKFQQTLDQSTESVTTKKDIPCLEKTSMELINVLNDKLFSRINNSAEDTGEPFTKAILLINEIIESTQRVQRSRIARNDKTDEPVEEAVVQSA
jgi:molecular chaperone GrpE (heat shock protein)